MLAPRVHISIEKGNEMLRVVSKSILASIAALALTAGIASAKFPGRNSEKSATVGISQSTQVPNGPTLRPGTYEVKLLSEAGTPQVGFYQNHKLVGQAPASLVSQGSKSTLTDVHLNNASGQSVLTQIDVNGWTKSIEFGQPSGSSGSGQ
jgi:hypothetical protein